MINTGYTITSTIPPQLTDSSKKFNNYLTAAIKSLIKITSTASAALTGAISINFFLSLFLGVSLKRLWMMISTLQIIVHLPLLSIYIPANTVLCFSTIVDISNLNIIPQKYMDDVMGLFANTSAGNSTTGNFH